MAGVYRGLDPPAIPMRVLARPFPGPGPLRLDADAVHVWQARLDAPGDEHLTADERARADRYHHPRTRRQFVATRSLLRALLGQYFGLPPAEVPLGYAPDGKPVVGSGGLEFNVSHTAGLAVFAVAARPVGVDVEAAREVANATALVGRFFTAEECEQYVRLPGELRPAAFLRGWTCKEAVLKGIGCGARDLDRCAVDVDPRNPPAVVGPAETVAGWAVGCWAPAEGYVAAVAVSGVEAVVVDVQ